MFVHVVLHGLAQITMGKAQNLPQNELKFSYSDDEKTKVFVC